MPTTTGEDLSRGCGLQLSAGTTSIELVTADGSTRTATQQIPEDYDPTTPAPVVLNFHGFTSQAADQHTYSGLPVLAESEGFVLLSPQGTSAPVFEQTYWNTETGRTPEGFDEPLVDDVGFVSELLDDLASRACIDLDRVHATGLSNGGFFSSRLACSLSERIASIATVGGVFTPPSCEQDRGVPTLFIHGTADPIVPFDASATTLGELLGLDADDVFGLLAGDRDPIPDIVSDWATRNGCAETTTIVALTDTVERRDHANCATATSFIVVDGGGHTWPGSEVRFEGVLGSTDVSFSAATVIWEWFVDHPREES